MYSVFATSFMLPPPRPPQPTTSTSILLLRSRPRTKAGAAATNPVAAAVWRNDRRVIGVCMERLRWDGVSIGGAGSDGNPSGRALEIAFHTDRDTPLKRIRSCETKVQRICNESEMQSLNLIAPVFGSRVRRTCGSADVGAIPPDARGRARNALHAKTDTALL